MESWQRDILGAVGASAHGLAEAKTHLVRAYNLALEHIALSIIRDFLPEI